MPQDLPTDAELLRAVAEEAAALRAKVSPDIGSRLALISHVVRIVTRNLESVGELDQTEHAALDKLLGTTGDLDELNRLLTKRIREKSIDLSDPEVRAHLRRAAVAKLAVAAPRHAQLRQASSNP